MANPWTRDQLDKDLPPFEMTNQNKKLLKIVKSLKQQDQSQKIDIQDLKSRVAVLENPGN